MGGGDLRCDGEISLSVIVPLRDQSHWLPEAVASIRRQAFDALEIWIVDDGSSDDAAGVVDALDAPIRFVRQANAGPAAARNRALERATGAFIAFLDADDRWPAEKLALQFPILRDRPEFQLVLGHIQRFDEHGAIDTPVAGPQLGSALFRRSAFDRVGLFDEQLRYSEDQDWFLRARELDLPMAALPETTLEHRRHAANMTRDAAAAGFQLTQVLKRSLDRRRARGSADEPLPNPTPLPPLVSVIIPVYDGERHLGDAIDSVLAQDHDRLEIVVVDDGSTDRSAEIAQSYGDTVRVVHQENAGTAAARNTGVEVSRGSVLAFLDQDDLWIPGTLGPRLEALSEPGVELVFGHVHQFLSPEASDELRQRIQCGPEAQPGYLPCAALVKRDAFFRVGSFELEWKLAEWVDWYLRATEQLESTLLPLAVARRRIHENNKGIRQREELREYPIVLKRARDRRAARQRSAS